MPAIEAFDAARAAAQLAECVREAGAVALSMFRTSVRNWTKAGSSPVSDADIAVDHLLRERLVGSDEAFGWLSEESVDNPARLAARYVWIVDPIDGTRAYLAGRPDWTISAALVEDGRPIAACLYAPVTEELFLATARAGATCNGTPIRVTSGVSLDHARLAGPKDVVEHLPTTPHFVVLPRIHSLALRLARVADGTCDIAIAGGNSHDWDLAAADLLVHEAGGVLTRFGGGAVTYNRPEPRHASLVAAGRDRHAALIHLLNNSPIASS